MSNQRARETRYQLPPFPFTTQTRAARTQKGKTTSQSYKVEQNIPVGLDFPTNLQHAIYFSTFFHFGKIGIPPLIWVLEIDGEL